MYITVPNLLLSGNNFLAINFTLLLLNSQLLKTDLKK